MPASARGRGRAASLATIDRSIARSAAQSARMPTSARALRRRPRSQRPRIAAGALRRSPVRSLDRTINCSVGADANVRVGRGSNRSVDPTIDAAPAATRGPQRAQSYARTLASGPTTQRARGRRHRGRLSRRPIDRSIDRGRRRSAPAATGRRRHRGRLSDQSIDPTIDRLIDVASRGLRAVVGIGAD